MFTNRFYYIKLLISVSFIFGAFLYSYYNGKYINPAFWVCQLRPDEFNGKHLWIPYTVIEKFEKDGFIINTDEHKIFVKGLTPKYGTGEIISLVGKFIKDGENGYIELYNIKKTSFTFLACTIANIISMVVLIYVAIAFVKSFRINSKNITFNDI